jgi:chromate reductase, NAD(P)H dehydrogenase (quinone)
MTDEDDDGVTVKAPRILVFSGSARRESLNKKLARAAAKFITVPGVEVTFIDLDDYAMPVYHGDLEAAEGMPANGIKLRELFIAHDALLIASPENNQSITSLLKNTLDWLSRSIGDGKGVNSGLAPFRDKVAALMGATPGPYGTLRGMPHLRQILAALGVTVLGPQVGIPRAHEAFDENGALKDPRVAKSVETLAASLVEFTRKAKG